MAQRDEPPVRELLPVQIQPGLYTLQTDRGAVNRWKDGDHVRFFRGMPEKLGGWDKITSSTFLGKARAAIDWRSLGLLEYIGFGTHLKLYIHRGGTNYDVTPYATTGTLGADPLATTNGSAVVTVTHNAHNLVDGQHVHYSGATAVGGITIDGEYTVTVVTANSYTITHTANATSTATGGGAAVAYSYELAPGVEDSSTSGGWGSGPWSAGTWGTPRTSTINTMCTIWSLDNWGEDLVACRRGGAIYWWDTSGGTGTRATIISGSPATAKAILVSNEERHLIALGAHDGSADDPLLVRWCSSEDFTDWTETLTNTAGSRRLDGGNEIYCGIKTDQEIVILTDATVHSMTFQGAPYQFDIISRGTNGGIMGPNAAHAVLGRVYWMGRQDFFYYDGKASVLPCDVRNHVFDDFNLNQRAKVVAGGNTLFGEVWWFYPSSGSLEPDRYVIYNAVENVWSYGTLTRTFYVGDSRGNSQPYAFGEDYYIYRHEVGHNDSGGAMEAFLQSWDVEVGNGNQLLHIKKIVPDFKTLTGTVNMKVTVKRWPQASDSWTQVAGTVSSTTEVINPNARGRQMSIELRSTAAGDNWRFGPLRIDAIEHGKL